MTTLNERSARHRAKLRRRTAAGTSRSPSPLTSPSPSPFVPSRSPSPLVLPTPLQLKLEHQAQLNLDFKRSSSIRHSPSHPSQSPRQLAVGDDQRQLLETQLHNTLKQLSALPHTASSRKRLESQARNILHLLDDLPPRPCPCPHHRDVPVGATVNDNRVVMDDSRIGTNDSRVMLAVV
jgi:hypothetical protein